MKHALVTTTINVPVALKQYAFDIAENGPPDTAIIVVGDQKTPDEARSFCSDLAAQSGVSITYLGVEEQRGFLTAFPDYAEFLPWNSIQRRNVAFLRAYIEGADVIYTIDDDNFLCNRSYISSHGLLGVPKELRAITAASGWYNVCLNLEETNSRKFFHRGYSQKQRSCPEPTTTMQAAVGRVVVNAGLWIGDPDVDAVTRLAIAPHVESCRMTGHTALAHGTISPFNSQNTAIHRDVIPAYCVHVGVGRYDDIVPAYFVKRIADHLGDYISFGEPIVRQIRNCHDLWKDVDAERIGYSLIDDIVEALYAVPLQSYGYAECVQELLITVEEYVNSRRNLTSEQRQFLASIRLNYTMWLSALTRC